MHEEKTEIRILIADDHPPLRAGLSAMLATEPGFGVIGEVGDGNAAVEAAVEVAPDVVLMDLQMPGMNGIDATRGIVERVPGVAVLVLTMHEEDESVLAAMRAGALGYLPKGVERDQLVRAIRAVSAGEAIFGEVIARRIKTYFAPSAGVAYPFPSLTHRERDVLEYLARGLDNAAIAEDLSVSRKTVQNHVSQIFAKLGVAGRPAAVVKARDAGIGISRSA